MKNVRELLYSGMSAIQRGELSSANQAQINRINFQILTLLKLIEEPSANSEPEIPCDSLKETLNIFSANLRLLSVGLDNLYSDVKNMVKENNSVKKELSHLYSEQAEVSKEIFELDTAIKKIKEDTKAEQVRNEKIHVDLQKRLNENNHLEDQKQLIIAQISEKSNELDEIINKIEFVSKTNPRIIPLKHEDNVMVPKFMEFRDDYDSSGELKITMYKIMEEYWNSPEQDGGMTSDQRNACFNQFLDADLDWLLYEYQSDFSIELDRSKSGRANRNLRHGFEPLRPLIQHFTLFLNHAGYQLSKQPIKYLAFIRYALMDYLVKEIIDQPVWQDLFSDDETTETNIYTMIYEADGADAVRQYRYLCLISLWSFKHNVSREFAIMSDIVDEIVAEFNEVVADIKLKRFSADDLKSKTTNAILESLDTLSGYQFEVLLEELFVAMGYLVDRTKKSGDQGADLICKKDGKKTVVQAKRYKKSVGNKAVQEVIASRTFYDADNAFVVTSSDFTSSAKILARGSDVQLWNRRQLEANIRHYL